MLKRKAKRRDDAGDNDAASDASSDSNDNEILPIDFEYFDPAEHDFHGVKHLLKQLFSSDWQSQLLQLSSLVNLILAQPGIGATVKVTDDEYAAEDNDPFAFVTALNLSEHVKQGQGVAEGIVDYLRGRVRSTGDKLPKLAQLLDQLVQEKGRGSNRIGLVLSERFINMPSEVAPPMYKMLLEEIEWAIAAKEPFDFTHFIILSKSYREVESKLSGNGEEQQRKKIKALGGALAAQHIADGEGRAQDGTFYFHPEDEIFEKHATEHAAFEYENKGEDAGDSKRVFQEAGIQPVGRLIFMTKHQLQQAVPAIQTHFGPPHAATSAR